MKDRRCPSCNEVLPWTAENPQFCPYCGGDPGKTYVLTDGTDSIFAVKQMTLEQFEQAAEEAVNATDGNLWWTLARSQSAAIQEPR